MARAAGDYFNPSRSRGVKGGSVPPRAPEEGRLEKSAEVTNLGDPMSVLSVGQEVLQGGGWRGFPAFVLSYSAV